MDHDIRRLINQKEEVNVRTEDRVLGYKYPYEVLGRSADKNESGSVEGYFTNLIEDLELKEGPDEKGNIDTGLPKKWRDAKGYPHSLLLRHFRARTIDSIAMQRYPPSLRLRDLYMAYVQGASTGFVERLGSPLPAFDSWYFSLRQTMSWLGYCFATDEEAAALYLALQGKPLWNQWFTYSNLVDFDETAGPSGIPAPLSSVHQAPPPHHTPPHTTQTHQPRHARPIGAPMPEQSESGDEQDGAAIDSAISRVTQQATQRKIRRATTLVNHIADLNNTDVTAHVTELHNLAVKNPEMNIDANTHKAMQKAAKERIKIAGSKRKREVKA